MSQIIITANYKIDPITGKVTDPQGNDRKVRPRTFKLLLLLLSKHRENVSKEDFLSQVWSDVVVGEHVVFQSIKEIRQVFEPLDVIKTVPKQGYTWVLPVEVPEQQAASQTQFVKANKNQKRLWFSGAALFAMVVAAWFWVSNPPPSRISGSLVILPMKDGTSDSIQGGLALGGMDQLIQRLKSGEDNAVLHTDNVLNIIARAELGFERFRTEDLHKIFQVSGANLVVETVLSGAHTDYQLLYTLHRQADSTKGVVFAESVPQVIEKLANIIAIQSGLEVRHLPTDYQSDFANEMIANALIARENEDEEQSFRLLEAVVASEKSNLTAKRLLLEASLKQGYLERTDELLQQAFLDLSKIASPNREQIRINFIAAVNALRKGELDSAELYLLESESLAIRLNDWQYLAYISSTRGRIAQSQQAFDVAQHHFRQSIEYHKVLQCPHGESNGLLSLSRLADARGKADKAKEYLQQALVLIKQRELNELEKQALEWQAKMANGLEG